jgi:hypothetical protein
MSPFVVFVQHRVSFDLRLQSPRRAGADHPDDVAGLDVVVMVALILSRLACHSM